MSGGPKYELCVPRQLIVNPSPVMIAIYTFLTYRNYSRTMFSVNVLPSRLYGNFSAIFKDSWLLQDDSISSYGINFGLGIILLLVSLRLATAKAFKANVCTVPC